MITFSASGNCNFQYISGLRAYYANEMGDVVKQVFTMPKSPYTKELKFRNPQCAFLIFAQGSEDPIKTRPYGPKLKAYIEEHGLGTVWESEPGPNPLHNNKPGIMFVWQLDYDSIKRWWNKNVRDVAKETPK